MIEKFMALILPSKMICSNKFEKMSSQVQNSQLPRALHPNLYRLYARLLWRLYARLLWRLYGLLWLHARHDIDASWSKGHVTLGNQ